MKITRYKIGCWMILSAVVFVLALPVRAAISDGELLEILCVYGGILWLVVGFNLIFGHWIIKDWMGK